MLQPLQSLGVAFFFAGVLVIPALGEAPLAPLTAVVFNEADGDSVALAKFYAEQRAIPADHLVGLHCSVDEEISREDYENTIAEPLRRIFKERGWWTVRTKTDGQETISQSSIRFLALMRGMPLKIHAIALPYPGNEELPGAVGQHNEASVDSELSTLATGSHQISGAIPNPYFQSFRAIREFENSSLILVCRLDGPTPSIVRRMITDSIATEKTGLWGRAYVDGSHRTAPGAEVGDKWLSEIVEQLHKTGIPVVFDDSPALFPEAFPMSDCALYYGWYAGGITGPFNQFDFQFVPGAIAVHIHSFSASTLRDVNAGWAGPLLARGAAATTGNVYEPFLQLTPHLDILNDRLLHGFTFAESAYMSAQALSWMAVMVGDPLYRPYASWLQLDATRDSGKRSQEWKMYHDFAVKNGSRPVAEYRGLAHQTAARGRNGPMLEDLGLIEEKETNLPAAISYFQQARACYSKRDDILRVVLEQAETLRRDKKPKRALDLIRSVLRIVPDAPASAMLRKMEQDLAAPPPRPPSP